jgi:hypothetical protein
MNFNEFLKPTVTCNQKENENSRVFKNLLFCSWYVQKLIPAQHQYSPGKMASPAIAKSITI